MPTVAPFGPQPQPLDFFRVEAKLDQCTVRALRSDDVVMTSTLFSKAYASWAGLAERELARTFGVELPVWGSRGKGPITHWRPILGKDRGSVRYPQLHTMRWLSSTFRRVHGFVSGSDWPQAREMAKVLAAPPASLCKTDEPFHGLCQMLDSCSRLASDCLGGSLTDSMIQDRSSNLDEAVAEFSGECTSFYATQARKDWSDWLNEQSDQGGRRANSFSIDPQA